MTVLGLLFGTAQSHDIYKDCGAIPKMAKESTVEETQLNAQAFENCFALASSNLNTDRSVVIPEGFIM